MTTSVADAPFDELEQFRPALTGYCYRMLGSPVDAQDAVQDTMIRAWRKRDSFEGRSQFRSWLYRIATNVCLDMLNGKERRTRPVDLGPAVEPVLANLHERPEAAWIEPIPDAVLTSAGNPADKVVAQETVRLAFIAALQSLPPKQRSVLILCEVLRWPAVEVAELLEMSTASVNSALQRARATLETDDVKTSTLNEEQKVLLDRYVQAFEAYDMNALAEVIKADAHQSMPPYDMWLQGRDDIFKWWFGPGIGCKNSRLLATTTANGLPAFGQYKPSEAGGYEPWALQVIELDGDQVGAMTFFLSTDRIFPVFGLPDHLDA
jgi:RNA polymerase sigma-70 factor, ECF subfamily